MHARASGPLRDAEAAVVGNTTTADRGGMREEEHHAWGGQWGGGVGTVEGFETLALEAKIAGN